MFTGIVEETGTIAAITSSDRSIELVVTTRVCAKGTRVGDSIAVNGCCLTATRISTVEGARRFHFDLLRETWNRTSFPTAARGTRVNLERALAAGGRLGGHFVTGHIDGTGAITRWERQDADHGLEISAPKEIRPYLVPKGSIAVDGISLTIAAVTRSGFRIWIIPHTFEVTALSQRKVGDPVNLEADLLGKYVRQMLRASRR
jgi:riboflavin synthase